MTHKFYTPTKFKYHNHDSQDQHQVEHLELNMEATMPIHDTFVFAFREDLKKCSNQVKWHKSYTE